MTGVFMTRLLLSLMITVFGLQSMAGEITKEEALIVTELPVL
jgi:hypothetical protein